ncbi:hypothetical protein BCON_0010g00480 [Botryotinia convoluta]|uniref:Methyltransferase n=1 Tax=Botryotinia convoluta TaxID=54673 RepID=A0A4Z1IWF5_9HELO|nr:hypothetical protein BCON_0010g00480 [Botryotinia convoluta]
MSTTLTEQAPSEHITKLETNPTTPHNIKGVLNYYLDPEDGSPPEPNYTSIRWTPPVSVDEEKIKSDYYKETEELLKRETGASKIFIFDHTIRREALDTRAPAPVSADSINKNPTPVVVRGPVQRVHIDQSYAASPRRVTHHLPEEAEKLLKGRFQIINVWRPIKTILKDPLGVAAANSVDDKDLVPIKLIYPDREGETYSVRHAPGHKWNYLYKQTPEEVLLIKCFDSKTDGRARRVPHSAFVNPEHEGEKTRESIEVRALVFHPDDTE